MKRSINPLVEHPTLFHSVIRALIHSSGVIKLERAIVKISAVIEHIEKQTSGAISSLEEVVHDLSDIVLQNRMALNFLLATKSLTLVVVLM